MRAGILFITLLLMGSMSPFTAEASLLCKGGATHSAPKTTKTGDSTVIQFVVWTAGSTCGPIKGKFTDISLHYRLVGQDNYATLLAKPIPLPENYINVESESLHSEAYRFVIPPYPNGTMGEIEYYIDDKFNGYANTTPVY